MAHEALKIRIQFHDYSVASFDHNELFGRAVTMAWDRQQMNLLVSDKQGEGPNDFTSCYAFQAELVLSVASLH